MKITSFLLSIFASTAVFAGNYQLTYSNSSAYLANCGGSVSLERDILTDELILSVDSLENCSNVTVDGQTYKIEESWLFGRSATFTVNERRGETRYVIHSNSGKTSDVVVVRLSGGSSNGSSVAMELSSCGGKLTARMESSGQVNLIFKGVRNCSNFDILSHNGTPVDYETKKLQEQSDGTRGGSFTIPNRFKSAFVNGVVIVVKSNSGKHQDRAEIIFK